MNAFLLETDLAAGLDPRRDLAADLAVQRGKLRLPAQDRHGIRDLRRCVQVQPVPCVVLVGIDMDLDQKIALLAIRSGHSASAQPDLLAFLDARRDLDFQSGNARVLPCRSGILQLDPLCRAECCVAEAHGHGACHIQRLLPGRAASCPAAKGLPAVTKSVESETSESRTSAEPASSESGTLRPSAENIPEHAAEQVFRVLAAEVEGLVSARPAAAVVLVAARPAGSAAGRSGAAAVKCRVAELVIELSLLRVAQDRVGLADILEFLLGVLVTRIRVRMVLLGKFPVRGLQFLIIC